MPVFNLQAIEQFDAVGTVFYQSSMASTSDVAKQKLLGDTATRGPLLVLCDQQTAGRGQRGRAWESDEQSLTFTWCVKVESVPQANRALLPLVAGASVCEAFESFGIDRAKLKWPNDVLVDRKKVCGILIERISTSDEAWFLIGIGINVNQSDKRVGDFDCIDSRFLPGSLSSFAGREIQLQSLLEALLDALSKNAFVHKDWQPTFQHRFDFLGQQVEVTKPDDEVIVGVFRGVDENGHMQIDCNGKLILIPSGQLT